jgi:uncharacterized protein YbjT (DUF2867 family)
MRIAVVGGTGTFGKLAVQELKARGHDVVTLSRNAPSGADAAEHRRVDVTTGDGLPAALEGIELVVDAANVPGGGKRARAVLVDGTRRVFEAAGTAGVSRYVLISIVGIERVPLGYYKLKIEQEGILAGGSGVAVTILRATQFHQLLDMAFGATSRLGFVPSASFPLQPVDPLEVATALADGIGDGPWDGTREFAGPEIRPLGELARAWRRGRGKSRLALPVWLPGKLGSGLRAGGLTSADAPKGKVTFEEWLSGSAA